MKCDHIFLVTNIARAITDSSLKSSMYNVLSHYVPVEWEESTGKYMKLAVVCTKSEVSWVTYIITRQRGVGLTASS